MFTFLPFQFSEVTEILDVTNVKSTFFHVNHTLVYSDVFSAGKISHLYLKVLNKGFE